MILNDIANALDANELELASDLIQSEWNRLGSVRTIYGIIRHGHIAVLDLLRKQKLCSVRDMVVLCSNALHELQIKQVCIAYDMHLYLLRLLASYGLRNFCGNMDTKQMDSPERSWMESIGLIEKWTEQLRNRKRWYDFLDVDNEAEFRVRMIHNEMFFIKEHRALKELPMREMIFCMAVFVKSLNNCPGDFLYRTIINQRNLVQFLTAVTGSLKNIKKNGDCVLRRHVVKKLLKAYRKLKQIRSVMKLVQNVPAKLDEFGEQDYCRSRAHITIAAMKRFIQVFGEAIKNTPDSPNFPTKLKKLLPVLFQDSLWLNSKYRDLSSHGYPLACLYTREFEQTFYYRHLKQYVMLIAISSLIFSVYIFHDCIQNLLGLMRRTTSIEDMRSLVRYAGNNKLYINQKPLFRNIFRYLEYCMYRLEVADEQNDLFVAESKESYIQKKILIEELNVVHREVEEHLQLIEIATFAKSNVQPIHVLVDTVLHSFRSRDSFRRIISEWRTGETMGSDYFTRTAISMQRYIHQSIELNHTYSDQWQYRKETDKIFALFPITDSDINPSDMYSKLHGCLVNGYYHNIFGLDHKAQAITKTLKTPFTGTKSSKEFKARNRKFKSIMDAIRQNDVILIGNEFRRIVQHMQQLFVENNCKNFGNFCLNFQKIPLKHRLALEYWQMQTMEILMKTKYFGDNFSTLKRSLPMMWGKTYRNYLAHDTLSYDLSTISDASRTFINGYVLAFESDELNIFSKANDFHLQGFMRIEEQGFELMHTQQNLLEAYRNQDENSISQLLQINADPWGRFYCAPGKFMKHSLCSMAEVLAHDTSDIANINPTAIELSFNDPGYSGIIFRAEINTNLFMNLQQFDFIDIEEAIEQFKRLQPELLTPCLGAALKYLAENSNFTIIQTLLQHYGDYAEKIINVGVGYAMDGAILSNPSIEMTNSQLDSFYQTKGTTLQDLFFIVRNNNVEALRIALRYYPRSLNGPGLDDIVRIICAAGRLELVKILLSSGMQSERIKLITAMHHHQWNIFDHLLKTGNDPWQDEGLLMCILVIERNFKLVRRIIRSSFPTELHHDIIRCIAKDGSVKLFKFVLNRVQHMWQCVGLLDCALKNSNPEVVRYLLDEIFKPVEVSIKHSLLDNWLMMLHEVRVLEFLKSESSIILTAVECNLEAADWIIRKLSEFSNINSLGAISVREHSYNEPVSSSKRMETIASILDEILCLSNGMQVLENTSKTTFFHQPCDLEVAVELAIFFNKPVSDVQIYCEGFPILDLNQLVEAIVSHLRSILGEYSDSHLISAGTISILQGAQLQKVFRILLTNSSYIAMEETNQGFDLEALFNIENFSAVHIVPPSAPTFFLQKILDLGADPWRIGKTKRTAFHVMLLDRHSLEHLQLVYEYCIKTNRTHCPNGTHIFNFADIDGYTPLCYAVRSHNSQIVDYMLQNGADPRVANHEGEAGICHDAILDRSVQMIQLLLNHCPPLINKPVNSENNNSLLEKAVEMNNSGLTQLLLDRGSMLGHRNRGGMTAVAVAIQQQSVESLQVLLDAADRKGESVTDSVTADGKSALDFAKQIGDSDTINVLDNYFKNKTS